MTALARTFYESSEAVESGYRATPLYPKIHRPQRIETFLDKKDGGLNLSNIRELRPIPIIRNEFPKSFQLLQQWEGQVTQVMADSFVAVVTDKSNPNNADEEVELDIMEVDTDDLRLVRPGSIFYWAVGYEDGLGTPRQRVSRIRFRRLPGLTTRDLVRSRENAKRFATLFE